MKKNWITEPISTPSFQVDAKRSTKEQCIRNNTDIEHGETIFTKKETNTVIQISWTRYGKYVEVDYWMEALQ